MILAALLLPVAWLVALPAHPAAADDVGWLRLAHLSPDTPAADLTVSPAGSSAAAAVEKGLGYGSVSPWHRLAPGPYTVALRAAGAAASSGPLLSARFDVTSGGALTVAAVGRFADLRLAVQDDDLSPPAAGRARARVVDAASTGPLDVSLAAGPALASGLGLGDSGRPAEVAGGRTALEVAAAGAPPQHVTVDLAAGSVTTLLVLDGTEGGLAVRPVLDAGGPSAAPVGPVPAGGGGTAIGTAGGPGPALLAALVGGAAGALLLVTFRPGRPRAGRGIVVGRAALSLVAVTGAVVAVAAPGPPVSVRTDPPVRVPGPVTVVGPAAATTAVPLRVEFPGVEAPVVPVGLDGSGALVPPEDVRSVGWFAGGPAPGDVGPAVIAGHVDSVDRPGAFFRLRALAPGDPITVTRADGSLVRFAVIRVARYAKTAFPTAEVYGATPDPELRLVTCGGAFDHTARSYADDVVVFARAVQPR